MTRQHSIVVFSGDLAYSVRRRIVEIDRAIPGLSWLVVLQSENKTPGQLLKSQWRNLRRNGWRWIPYQLADIWRRLKRPEPAMLDAGVPGSEFTLSAVQNRPNLRLIRVPNLHAQACLDAVQAFEPDLGLSMAAPILRRSLFAIPRLGTINLHKGKVPEYRGMPPAFWELWDDAKSVGCTVHRVDDKLDTGNVVCQAAVERAKHSTLTGLQLQVDEVGMGLMRDAVSRIIGGNAASLPQAPGGSTHRKPTLAQAAALQRKLVLAQSPRSSLAARSLKSARSALGFGAWRAGLRRLLTPRVTVVLYHRVSDDTRDNLTVGIEQFDRQMGLLRKHCRPVSIEQALAMDTVPRSDLPLVAVSFDDGYLDNCVNAAPILMRHGIPASFFVATGIVDAHGRFPHDMRRGNPPIPVMTWDHLRQMRDWGFTIGSHSVSHIDCAAEPEDTVRSELVRSREDLHRELGIAEPLFAYPYGGRQHMTPERLELVKQAGYRGCLGAYGGTNVGRVDRYDVRRRGIHWEFSDSAFLFECLGLV